MCFFDGLGCFGIRVLGCFFAAPGFFGVVWVLDLVRLRLFLFCLGLVALLLPAFYGL